MFGTKAIMAKVINGKLVIRVGGGYMAAEEFINQYGPMEMAKMMEASGQKVFTGGKQSATGRASVRIMDQMREKMRNSNLGQIMADGLNDQYGLKPEDAGRGSARDTQKFGKTAGLGDILRKSPKSKLELDIPESPSNDGKPPSRLSTATPQSSSSGLGTPGSSKLKAPTRKSVKAARPSL